MNDKLREVIEKMASDIILLLASNPPEAQPEGWQGLEANIQRMVKDAEDWHRSEHQDLDECGCPICILFGHLGQIDRRKSDEAGRVFELRQAFEKGVCTFAVGAFNTTDLEKWLKENIDKVKKAAIGFYPDHPATKGEKKWRCATCDKIFTDEVTAGLHAIRDCGPVVEQGEEKKI
jgi:hypothetical protein